MQTYQLFCGRDIPSGGHVDDNTFQYFLEYVVNPLFDGYTVTDVQGKGCDLRTLSVSHSALMSSKVLAIANEYKQLFAQDSVAIQTLAPMAFV